MASPDESDFESVQFMPNSESQHDTQQVWERFPKLSSKNVHKKASRSSVASLELHKDPWFVFFALS